MSLPHERTRYRTVPGIVDPYGYYSIQAPSLAQLVAPATETWLTLSSSRGSVTETTYDIDQPNHKSRLESGEIINNPFKRTRVTVDSAPVGPYSHIWSETDGSIYYKGGGIWRSTPPAYLEVPEAERLSLRQAVIDLAVTNAHANVDQSKMLALATVAESRKSVESMRAILWRLYRVLKAVRKLDLRSLKREISPKELADRYMELRYAIRPLIYDAKGVIKALEAERTCSRQTYRSYAADGQAYTDTLLNLTSGLNGTVRDWSREARYTVSARAGVLCDVRFTELTAFGFDQLLETGWELIPFSFIADWFTNAGNWIAAHTPNAGVRQRASWVSVSENYTQIRTALGYRSIVDTMGYNKVSLTLPPGWWKREELVLERITEPQISTFPSVNVRLDAYKLTDLGIIIRKLFT